MSKNLYETVFVFEVKFQFWYDNVGTCNNFRLRQRSESLRLIGSAMFGAIFNLVTRVGLP